MLLDECSSIQCCWAIARRPNATGRILRMEGSRMLVGADGL
jgi:hypothetical protein